MRKIKEIRMYEQMVIDTIYDLESVYGLEFATMVDNNGWHIKFNDKPFMTCNNEKECYGVLKGIFTLYKMQRGA